MRTLIHYFLHLGLPFFIAYFFFRPNYRRAYLILLLTMLVDLDHLFAEPIFDPDRCSINFHFLHSYAAMLIYNILLLFKKTRLIAIGLLLHMITDQLDCWLR